VATGCGVGLLLMLITATTAEASPDARAFAPGALDLRLDGPTARRLLAESQEADTEKQKTDEDRAESDKMKVTVTKVAPGEKGPAAPPSGEPDKLAFLKDWPFWVIVGGVVIAGVATYMIVQNSSSKHPCSAMFDAGCFGAGQ